MPLEVLWAACVVALFAALVYLFVVPLARGLHEMEEAAKRQAEDIRKIAEEK